MYCTLKSEYRNMYIFYWLDMKIWEWNQDKDEKCYFTRWTKFLFFLNIKFQQTIEACDPLRAKICVWFWLGPERGVPNSAWNALPDRGHGFPPWHSFPWSRKSVAQVGLRVSCWVWARSVNFCTGHVLHNKRCENIVFFNVFLLILQNVKNCPYWDIYKAL